MAAAPGRGEGEEEPVGAVEGAGLEADGQRGVGLLPKEVVEDERGGGVVRPVHEGRRVLLPLERGEAVQEDAEPVGVERADGLAQVAEGLFCFVFLLELGDGWVGNTMGGVDR